MAVAFDAQSSSDTTANAATSFSDSTKLTVGAGANRALLVLIAWSTAAAPTGVSITWDGQPLTLISGTSVANGTAGNVALYGLIAPNSGTKTLAGSWTGAREFYVSGIAYTGVNQTSVAVAFPHGTTGSSNTATSTVTVTSAVGNAVAAVHTSNGSFSAVNNTQVFLDNVSASISGAGNRAAGAATVTLTGTQTGNWASAGVDILAGGAAAVVASGNGSAPSFFVPTARPLRFKPNLAYPKVTNDYTLPVSQGTYTLGGNPQTLTSNATPVTIGTAAPKIFVPGAGPNRGIQPNLAYPPSVAGAQALTLSPTTGTYTLSGKAQTLNAARSIAAAQGTYTLNGVAQTLNRGILVSPATGTYSLSGVAQFFGIAMPAAQGSYSLGGQTVTLAVGIPAGAGVYAVSGQPQAFAVALSVRPVSGTYAVGGNAAGLSLTPFGSSNAVHGNPFLASPGLLTSVP